MLIVYATILLAFWLVSSKWITVDDTLHMADHKNDKSQKLILITWTTTPKVWSHKNDPIYGNKESVSVKTLICLYATCISHGFSHSKLIQTIFKMCCAWTSMQYFKIFSVTNVSSNSNKTVTLIFCGNF